MGSLWECFSLIVRCFSRNGRYGVRTVITISNSRSGGHFFDVFLLISLPFPGHTPRRVFFRLFVTFGVHVGALWDFICENGSQSDAQWAPKSIKKRQKVVSGIQSVSPWLPDPPRAVPGAQKVPKLVKNDRFLIALTVIC